MKDNKSGWQFPKALEIIKCKEGNKEFMKERPARRPFGNTVLICEYPIDDTAAEEPNAKLITWRLAKRAARDFLRVSFMPSAIVAKAGFLLQAVIMPYDVINQQFVESLQDLTRECEFSLSEKERREREARDRFTFTEPEQCSLNVDPDTGEVVEESEVADE
jgi:hypothetical protein